MATLYVESFFCYPLENATAHHTDRFEIIHVEQSVPILRRGQEFHCAIRFSNRNYIKGQDAVRIIFNNGSNPNAIKGTQGQLILSEDPDMVLDSEDWMGKILEYQEQLIICEIITPFDAPIGPWEVIVKTKNGIAVNSYTFDNDFWLLFNPWNKKDLTYMPETDLLDEYVLSDVGKIWVGPWGAARGREWIYGQFDSCILPACILMLDRSNLAHTSRNDPILMSRAISRIVNSNDDHGAVVGRWDGDYLDGTAPSSWTGSVDILNQFLRTQTEVKYGQCWVFAGVATTVCRALGIPSRVVSNLVSAHDSNGSLTVDKYYDKNNNELDYDPLNPMGEDSIWNYHVWSDVYMARPDLPTGYGGWQAIDATPQETSNGYYQCGPSSLEAIRQGQVGMNYDVPFMIASVNADFMKWKEDEKSVMGYTRIDCNQYHVGRQILTKQPFVFDPNGDKDREDITLQYKQQEGSKGERLSLFNAVRNTTRAKRFYDVPDKTEDDIEFTLSDLVRVDIGQPFNIVLELKNNSKEKRTVDVSLSANSIFYTGVKANSIKRSAGDVTIQPNGKEVVRMVVTPEEYLTGLVEYSIMKIYAICTVKETKQTWSGEDDFQVIKPTIHISFSTKGLKVDQTSTVILQMKNPLKQTLTSCEFQLASPGLIRRTIVIPFRDCRPGETINVHASVTPWKVGNYKLVATFSSKQLSDVTGSNQTDII